MKKITSQRKKLQKTIKIKENLLVCNKKKVQNVKLAHLQIKMQGGNLKSINITTTKRDQQTTTKQNIKAPMSTKDQRGI